MTRLTEELAAGESDEYLTATINEILRLSPVLPERRAAADQAAGPDRRR